MREVASQTSLKELQALCVVKVTSTTHGSTLLSQSATHGSTLLTQSAHMVPTRCLHGAHGAHTLHLCPRPTRHPDCFLSLFPSQDSYQQIIERVKQAPRSVKHIPTMALGMAPSCNHPLSEDAVTSFVGTWLHRPISFTFRGTVECTVLTNLEKQFVEAHP